MNNHSLPHRCDTRLRNIVINELIRQRQPDYKSEEQKHITEYL